MCFKIAHFVHRLYLETRRATFRGSIWGRGQYSKLRLDIQVKILKFEISVESLKILEILKSGCRTIAWTRITLNTSNSSLFSLRYLLNANRDLQIPSKQVTGQLFPNKKIKKSYLQKLNVFSTNTSDKKFANSSEMKNKIKLNPRRNDGQAYFLRDEVYFRRWTINFQLFWSY